MAGCQWGQKNIYVQVAFKSLLSRLEGMLFPDPPFRIPPWGDGDKMQ